MNIRYQIFISSTFTDLEAERRIISKTLMEMDCIPAGMEWFPAIDEEQFAFIKKIIDESDYYLLIIGGRWSSPKFAVNSHKSVLLNQFINLPFYLFQ